MVEDIPAETTPVGQLALVGLCALGLVVAGVALPASTPTAGPLDLGFLFEQEPTDCTVRLVDEPVPGEDATVVVEQRGARVADAPVWYNGEYVGRTNDRGRATGVVPYVETLRVQVRLPSGGRCAFVRGPERGEDDPIGDGATAPALGTGPLTTAVGPGAVDRLVPEAGPAQADDASNQSGEYTVHSAIDVRVIGETYPGDEVTVVATIDDRAVPEATVEIDGQQVGTTDENGRLRIETPADGRKRITVTVTRGELVSERRVPVLVLDVHFRTSTVPLPGERAAAVATLGGEPVADAAVSLDSRRLGTTDAGGTTGFSLPADPTATVTVEWRDQSATRALWWAYLPTALWTTAGLVLFVGVPLAAYVLGGRRGLAVTGVVALLAVAGLVGRAVGGTRGSLLGMSLVALALAAVVARRRGVSVGKPDPRRLRTVVSGRLLAATRRVETLLDRSRRRVRALWLRLRRQSVLSLVRSLWAWLAGLGRRIAGAVTDTGGGSERPTDSESGTAIDAATGSRPADIRSLWRRFARRVTDTWRTQTPGEVSREAIAQGLPDEPVRDLTALFRDVEYGGREVTSEVDERARRAVDTIERARRTDGEDEP